MSWSRVGSVDPAQDTNRQPNHYTTNPGTRREQPTADDDRRLVGRVAYAYPCGNGDDMLPTLTYHFCLRVTLRTVNRIPGVKVQTRIAAHAAASERYSPGKAKDLRPDSTTKTP